MMKYIEDLRFVIGVFFVLVSLILLTVGFTNPTQDTNLNLWAGGVMGVFAVLMVGMSLARPLK